MQSRASNVGPKEMVQDAFCWVRTKETFFVLRSAKMVKQQSRSFLFEQAYAMSKLSRTNELIKFLPSLVIR